VTGEDGYTTNRRAGLQIRRVRCGGAVDAAGLWCLKPFPEPGAIGPA
jgi:hypothetical protein